MLVTGGYAQLVLLIFLAAQSGQVSRAVVVALFVVFILLVVVLGTSHFPFGLHFFHCTFVPLIS